jgi:hypothetical protein
MKILSNCLFDLALSLNPESLIHIQTLFAKNPDGDEIQIYVSNVMNIVSELNGVLSEKFKDSELEVGIILISKKHKMEYKEDHLTAVSDVFKSFFDITGGKYEELTSQNITKIFKVFHPKNSTPEDIAMEIERFDQKLEKIISEVGFFTKFKKV